MSKGNLIERMGAEYCTQRMNGTLFNYKGEAYEFGAAADRVIQCTKYTGTPEQAEAVNAELPWSVFDTWKALSWPTLGYRQAADGQVIMSVGRRGGVQRGLCSGQLTVNLNAIAYASQATFGTDIARLTRGAPLCLNVMQPRYTKFSEGLAAVLRRDIPAFVVSADFAVVPHEQVPFLEVLFRGRRIGTIEEDGTVNITADSIKPSWYNAINK